MTALQSNAWLGLPPDCVNASGFLMCNSLIQLGLPGGLEAAVSEPPYICICRAIPDLLSLNLLIWVLVK